MGEGDKVVSSLGAKFVCNCSDQEFIGMSCIEGLGGIGQCGHWQLDMPHAGVFLT